MEIENTTVLELPAKPGNPRNSEGAFLALRDGRIMYVYSRYCGESWGDDDASDLAVRYSDDGGENWSREDQILLTAGSGNHDNLMSVSLERLPSGRILMFYLAKDKNSSDHGYQVTCMPKLSYSDDEGVSWSEERNIILSPGFHVLNNDRVIRLKSGRLLLPIATHRYAQRNSESHFGCVGIGDVYYSDDDGAHWTLAPESLFPEPGNRDGLQEPGLIELADGRVQIFFRTSRGFQYQAFSTDGGESWSVPIPSFHFPSPLSPLSIRRDPFSQRLVAVWNDNDPRWGLGPQEISNIWRRTPLVIAFSDDEGEHWYGHQVIADDPMCGYCYNALYFPAPGRILVGGNCGGHGKSCLQDSFIKLLCLK